MDLTINASIIEEGLVEHVEAIMERNKYLFSGEKVVLMADAHKTTNDINSNSVPVGFTMTLSKGYVPVDFVSADMFCGVTSLLIKDYVPKNSQLQYLSKVIRDVVPIMVNPTYYKDNNCRTLGTLGNGNHFVSVGVNGKDTLISVHTGSRGFGGEMFKKHKAIAKKHTRELNKLDLTNIEPKLRQEALNAFKEQKFAVDVIDTTKYPQYWDELRDAESFASLNRNIILRTIMEVLNIEHLDFERIESVHNYVDTSGNVPIVRKGSIAAKDGEMVTIPLNMRDGVVIGRAKGVGETNYSLPHGAGRVLSRKVARDTLDIREFKKTMKDVVSPTISYETLDESPMAYKPKDVILQDIKPYLDDVRVFKEIFNYKGV